MRFLLTIAAALTLAASVQAATVVIDTPHHRYVAEGCTFTELHAQRHGTTWTILGDCSTAPAASAQAPGWAPQEHPDGLVLRFESRVRLGWTAAPWIQCEVVDVGISPWGGMVQVECLDDPLVFANGFGGAR